MKKIICKLFGHKVVTNVSRTYETRFINYWFVKKKCKRCGSFISAEHKTVNNFEELSNL